MANIKHVAARAGVSTATVSKYLNGITVRKKNELAIENAIKELDYQLNNIARGLRTSKSHTIGILIPDLAFSFFTQMISDIENRLEDYGYSSIVCDYKSNPDLEAKKFKFLLSKQVDGIIMAPMDTAQEFTKDVTIPIVYIDQLLNDPSRDYVIVNNCGASYHAITYILSRGHKSVGLINGPMNTYTARERLKGYYNAFCDAGLQFDTNYIKFKNFDITSGYELTHELLDLPVPPTALFATNNDLTIGAILALNERKVMIGRDISLIGYDNFEIAMTLTPKLTIVSQPIEEISKVAVSTMLKRLRGEGPPCVTTLETELILQDSVKQL